MPAEYTTLLNDNPDRGWASNEVFIVPEVGDAKLRDSYETIKASVKSKLNNNTYDQTVKLSRIFFRMTNYKTVEDLPDEAVTYIKNVLRAYKELGVKVYLNIYYQTGTDGTETDNSKVYDATPVNANIVLSHIDQYAEIWEEYSDVIYCYCMSLLGRWGEWAAMHNGIGAYEPIVEEEKTQIVHKVLDKLPENIYVTLRDPDLAKYAEGHTRASNIGYDQSAFFGYNYTDVDLGGDYRPGKEKYTTAMNQAPYALMFAETYTTSWFNNNPDYQEIEALGAIKGLSEQRINAFNINHAYGDNAKDIENSVLYKNWKIKDITKTDLQDNGVLVTDNWFKSVSGEEVTRSAFDYIKDYLGYRISAEKVSVTGGNNVGEKIEISMDFRNYGFSAAFNLESGFVILDENNKVISEKKVGNPAEWHSTSPEDYSARTQLSHNVTADMNLPSEAGTYKIAFFLRNSLGQTARLDNLIEYADGYNILHMFTID